MVDPNGPAAEKGISEGDRIIQVSQEDVSTPGHVAKLVKEAEEKNQKSVFLTFFALFLSLHSQKIRF